MSSSDSEVQYVHPNLKQLSHSSDILLDKCPRKFELYKLSNKNDWKSELHSISNHEELSNVNVNDVHLDFGSLVGIGTQEFLVSGDAKKAAYKMFCSCPGSIDDTAGEMDKKTFWYALYALDKFINLRNTALSDFEVAIFEGKPAIELGFIIDCGNGFNYRGFVDAVLLQKSRPILFPYEGKTTKFKNLHEAMYKHSGQALGYSLVLDVLAPSLGVEVRNSFDVKYSAYKSGAMEWEMFNFTKNFTQRALWIKNLLLRMSRIEQYASMEYFPMHGWNCYDFFRPCEHFGTCEMSNSVLVPEPEVKVEDTGKYQFKFNLEEVIEAQLERQGKA